MTENVETLSPSRHYTRLRLLREFLVCVHFNGPVMREALSGQWVPWGLVGEGM